MKLFEFERHFPDEESCRNRFRDLRLKQGVVCPKCGCTHHYWKSDKGMFQCKECGHRQSLRYGIPLLVHSHAPAHSHETYILCR